MPKKIYLDYAATTPLAGEVLEEMLPYFNEKFGNAMSVHSFGQEAWAAVDKVRIRVAWFLGCSPREVIFTSGATESNNLAIKGVVRSYYAQNNKQSQKPHIITTQFEHHCVLHACQKLEKDSLAEVMYLPVSREGIVALSEVKKAIRTNTILISVMYVNNEIGTVQPIGEIGGMVKKENENRLKEGNQKIIFHTDATQAVNYFNCNTERLGVDLLSFSGHKIYGPKGVGVLYVRKNTSIKAVQDGGDQEYKLRAGTHNVPGIVGLGKSIELVQKNQKKETQKITVLREYLIDRIFKEIPRAMLNGSRQRRSPNNANFSFQDVEGEGLLLALDMEGVACSTGSACSSGSLSPSHVLLSLGLKPEEAHGSLRMTLGRYTTKKDIDTAVGKLKRTVERLRKISGNVLADFKTLEKVNYTNK